MTAHLALSRTFFDTLLMMSRSIPVNPRQLNSFPTRQPYSIISPAPGLECKDCRKFRADIVRRVTRDSTKQR